MPASSNSPNRPLENFNHAPVRLSKILFRQSVVFLLTVTFLALSFLSAKAQEMFLRSGDGVVTGFSGVVPKGKFPSPTGNPLDSFFIDMDGAAAQIRNLRALGGPADGSLHASAVIKRILARDVGQVFGIAIDDRRNTYLAATSAYGLQVVAPDSDGDGLPNRIRKGQPDAAWMPGQFVGDTAVGTGGPGAIWKIDGTTGDVSLFAVLPNNGGAGIGNLAFHKRTRQLFATDLDTGLIHRINENGTLLGTFDHGIKGRPVKGLGEIADDGKQADIAAPEFDSENPSTWGYTQAERRVHGLAIRGGRLYYAVQKPSQIWSIRIRPDGQIGNTPRWEFDVADAGGSGPIADLTFDKSGRIYLARRGAPKGSYDYSVFATAEKSSVTRYTLEQPDNPATESRWILDPESYAIGMTPDHNNANGGIALGYGYDENGNPQPGTFGDTLWSTGGRLRTGELDAAEFSKPDVIGLQGNAISLVRPQNEPPQQSYFLDYDGFFGDPEKAGHMGDVEIAQFPGEKFSAYTPEEGGLPPGYLPPGDTPPDGFPEDWPDPEYPYNTNLKLTKKATPKKCSTSLFGYACRYRVRIRNEGPDAYFGPLFIRDWVPSGAPVLAGFIAPAPWSCWNAAPSDYRCFRPATFLAPGASVAFDVVMLTQDKDNTCRLQNAARILWAPGGTKWNTKLFDDFDTATAIVPNPKCDPEPKKNNLVLSKRALGPNCVEAPGNKVQCNFQVKVTNAGPGEFTGKLHIRENMDNASVAGVFGIAPWSCGPDGANYLCEHPSTTLGVGESRFLFAFARFDKALAKEMDCKFKNGAKIVKPVGGTAKNTNAGDDIAFATQTIPAELCKDEIPPVPQQCPPGFNLHDGQCDRIGTRKPPVIIPPVVDVCPRGFLGTPPNCYRRPVVDPKCPRGFVGTPPNCRRIEPPKVCPPRTTGKYPLCRPIVRPCPGGTIRRRGRCIKVIQPCPYGMVRKGGRCRPIVRPCPRGTIRRGGRCIKVIQPCPQGMVRKGGRCRPIVRPCPRGTIRRSGRCIKVIKPCPRGTVRRGSRCIKVIKPCARGTIRRGGRCIKVIKPCTKGTIRVRGRCIRVQSRPQVRPKLRPQIRPQVRPQRRPQLRFRPRGGQLR